jgi:hypothetical protein
MPAGAEGARETGCSHAARAHFRQPRHASKTLQRLQQRLLEHKSCSSWRLFFDNLVVVRTRPQSRLRLLELTEACPRLPAPIHKIARHSPAHMHDTIAPSPSIGLSLTSTLLFSALADTAMLDDDCMRTARSRVF